MMSRRTILLLGAIFIGFSSVIFSCRNQAEKSERRQPIVAEVTIPVQGMTCGSCEHHIETEVIRNDGVIEIHADHEKAIAHVKYDSSKISLDQLVAAINATGYKASLPGSSDQ